MDSENTILVVDDDPDLLRLLTIRLKAAGYNVIAAEDADQALTQFAISRPQLVITDLRMPGMDGIALFESIQRRDSALPVIILTAHGTIPDAVSATRQGVFGYLTKPIDTKVLLDEVQRALTLRTSGSLDSPPDWRSEIITRSPIMEDVLAKAKMAAGTNASVLIQGSTGTGKELVARAIHRASDRRKNSFVAINCSAIPENLLESELFGYTKGAFTGATRDHSGLFVHAAGGTLFLDEIGDMPIALQVKLLRVLQDQNIRPLGSNNNISIDVRVISATHRDLKVAIENGAFREDLYYRLNVISLTLPPLSERKEDIPILVTHFINLLAKKYERRIKGFAPDALELLVAADWPGNIRHLFNLVERAVTLSPTEIVSLQWLQTEFSNFQMVSLEEARKQFERDYLTQLLKITEGNVTRAARLAKRNRTEFYKLLGRHKIDSANFKRSNV